MLPAAAGVPGAGRPGSRAASAALDDGGGQRKLGPTPALRVPCSLHPSHAQAQGGASHGRGTLWVGTLGHRTLGWQPS